MHCGNGAVGCVILVKINKIKTLTNCFISLDAFGSSERFFCWHTEDSHKTIDIYGIKTIFIFDKGI